jgi:hypothetical protein
MSRFAEARQGRGPRLPKTVRPAFFVIGAIMYSQVRADLVRTTVGTAVPIPHNAVEESRGARIAVINEAPALRVTMQLEEIPDTSLAADLCRRILRSQEMTAAARARKGAPK